MNRLRELREDRDLKQTDIAQMMSLTPMAVSRYEREENALTAELIAKFCKLFDVTADYLLGFSRQPRPTVSESDTEILHAYHAAPAEIRAIIDTALAPYKQSTQGNEAAS